MSARRTFGILISARGLLGCAFRCYGWGPRGEIGVFMRAWRSPAAQKRDSSGLPTASSAARAGVGTRVRGRRRATPPPSRLWPTPSTPSRAPWRSWPCTASCRRRPWPPCGRSACGCTSSRGAAPRGRPLTRIVFSDTRAGGIVWPRCPRLHTSRWTEGLPHGRQSEEVHRRVQAGDSRLRHLHGAPHNPGLRGARAQPQDGERLGAQAQARVGGRARPEGRGARASRGEEAHTRARGGERVPKKAAAFFAKEQAL